MKMIIDLVDLINKATKPSTSVQFPVMAPTMESLRGFIILDRVLMIIRRHGDFIPVDSMKPGWNRPGPYNEA